MLVAEANLHFNMSNLEKHLQKMGIEFNSFAVRTHLQH